MRRVCWAAAVLTLLCPPVAAAGRRVSVGYRTPSALRGLDVVRRIDALHIAEVRVRDRAAEVRLGDRPGVRFVTRLVPRHDSGDPAFSGGGLATAEWQWTASHADRVPSWVQRAASSIRIAVVDTGADLSVPSLAPKNATAWSVTTDSTSVRDQIGHGTFVASLAAGASLGFGGDAQLMIVQANRGTAGFSDVDEADAIVWAVDHGANVVNLSIGGNQTSSVERAAIRYAIGKGVLLVAAAGNAALQGNPVQYPAALIGRDGLVVGAADKSGRRAAFSSTGSWVDLLAPGVDVVGAMPTGASTSTFFTPLADTGYGVGSGTSYAAPEVAGAAALVWAAAPSLDAAGVAQTIEASASGAGTWSQELGFGDLDVAAAVQRALGGSPPAVVPPASHAEVVVMKQARRAAAHAAGKRPH
ncbi:MAG TPA: S8 family serine peptidase [Gaiellaceae bacterium]